MISFELKGPDAREFLGRVTAGPVKSLKPGEGARGLLLNGQSRVLAQFDLLCLEGESFLLVAPAECADALMEGLDSLQFAENFSLARSPRWARIVADPAAAGGQVFSFAAPALRWPAVVPGFSVEVGEAAPPPAGFDFARIGALVPWPGLDWVISGDASTPALEAGFLDWVDRFKGCYPGQEVIELSLNVGRPARVLQAYEAAFIVEVGARLSFAEGGEAIVTSVAQENGRTRFLARVPWARKNAALGEARLLKGWEFSR